MMSFRYIFSAVFVILEVDRSCQLFRKEVKK